MVTFPKAFSTAPLVLSQVPATGVWSGHRFAAASTPNAVTDAFYLSPSARPGRTIQGRLLLRPSQEFRSITIGILACAQRLYNINIHAFIVLSSHYHTLLSVNDFKQLADLMCYINSNLAREAGRLYEWKEKFWRR